MTVCMLLCLSIRLFGNRITQYCCLDLLDIQSEDGSQYNFDLIKFLSFI